MHAPPDDDGVGPDRTPQSDGGSSPRHLGVVEEEVDAAAPHAQPSAIASGSPGPVPRAGPPPGEDFFEERSGQMSAKRARRNGPRPSDTGLAEGAVSGASDCESAEGAPPTHQRPSRQDSDEEDYVAFDVQAAARAAAGAALAADEEAEDDLGLASASAAEGGASDGVIMRGVGEFGPLPATRPSLERRAAHGAMIAAQHTENAAAAIVAAEQEGLPLERVENSTGFKGVLLHAFLIPRPYEARARWGGKELYARRWLTPEEAALARARKLRELQANADEDMDEVFPPSPTAAAPPLLLAGPVPPVEAAEAADAVEAVEAAEPQPLVASVASVAHVHHAQTDDEVRDFMLLCAADSPALVRVSRHLLGDYGIMWARLVDHQPPKVAECGCRFWTVDCTHACLLCVVQSLRAGGLQLREDTTMQEVLAEFAYAGMRPPALRRRDGEPARRLITAPEMLLGPGSSAEFRRTALCATCEAIANAICCWPRLQEVVNSAVSGEWPSTATSCSTSSAWICFASSPILPTRPCHRARPDAAPGPYMTVRLWDSLAGLAAEWPAWLQNTLAAMMCIVVDARTRPPENADATIAAAASGVQALPLPATFAHVQSVVQSSQSGEFWTTPYDYAHGTCRTRNRTGSAEVHAMVSSVRACLSLLLRAVPRPHQANSFRSDAHPLGSEPHWLPTNGPAWLTVETASEQWHGWAENFVMLAWGSIKGTCSPKVIFSESCVFGEMRVRERKALADAFAKRGITLVQWAEGEAAAKRSNPLLFPPAWVDEHYMFQHRGASYYEARGNGPFLKIAWDQ